MGDDEKVIVVDNGTFMIKTGFVGDETVATMFRNVITGKKVGDDSDYVDPEEIVGKEALNESHGLVILHPIENRIVVDWAKMETVWKHTFMSELKIDPTEYTIILTQPALNPKENTERMVRLMFQAFSVPAVCVQNQAFLSLFSAERNTGVVVDCGYTSSQTTPIYDSFIIPHAVNQINVGGKDATEYLAEILSEVQGQVIDESEVTFDDYRDIKESLAFVSEDLDVDMRIAAESDQYMKEYEVVASGKELKLGNERFRCAEVFFQPSFVRKEDISIQQAAFKSFMGCDKNIRQEMTTFVLAGGSSELQGFQPRLKQEIQDLAPRKFKMEVVAPGGRSLTAFEGGCRLVAAENFHDCCLHKEEYDEKGAEKIHDKMGEKLIL